jgi:hypothetical protein
MFLLDDNFLIFDLHLGFLLRRLFNHPITFIGFILILWSFQYQLLLKGFFINRVSIIEVSLGLGKPYLESFLERHSIGWSCDQIFVQDWVNVALLNRRCDALGLLIKAFARDTPWVATCQDLLYLLFHEILSTDTFRFRNLCSLFRRSTFICISGSAFHLNHLLLSLIIWLYNSTSFRVFTFQT